MRLRGKDVFAPLRGLGVGASPDEFGAAITREQVAALQGELPSGGGKADLHMEPSATERSASKEPKDPSKESKDLSKEPEDL